MRKKTYFFFLAIISVFPALVIFSFSVRAGREIGKLAEFLPIGSPLVYESSRNKTANTGDIFNPGQQVDNSTAGAEDAAGSAEEISLLFVGDIMLDRGVAESVNKNAAGDYFFPFEKVAGFIADNDFAFGNLEGPVSDVGRDLRNLYSFRMEPKALAAIKKAGFDGLSVANNHAGDWGRTAFEDTLANLKNNGILAAGGGLNKKEAMSPKVAEIKGLKIGFLAFSDVGPGWLKAEDGKSGVLLADDDLPGIIKKAAEETDVLAVSFHFGDEYKINRNERQEFLARTAIDSGAKIIAGHHPHVVQETERYNGGVIAYSLGNFVFDQNFSEETMRGAALEVKLSPAGEIKSAEMKGIKINRYFQPELAQ